MYLDMNIRTWIWSIILSLARNLQICFTSILIFFAYCARRMMLWKYQEIPFRLYLLEIYNTRFGWFDLKFVKHARWIFANMQLQCTWWPHFVNKFKYFFYIFKMQLVWVFFLQDSHLKIGIKQRVQTVYSF